MIASNYRKHPDAMALQLPLPFPHRLVWALPRPGARILRAIRVARAKAFNAAGRIAYPIKRAVPAWWTDAKRRAKNLAGQVRDACQVLWAEVRVAEGAAETTLLAFNLEPYAAPWNEQQHNELMQRRRAATDNARCPTCGTTPHGWTPNWKRGIWSMSCNHCGTDWDEKIPH